MRYLQQRPWLWIVFAFLVLIASWIVLMNIAIEHRPAEVELAAPPDHDRP